VDGDAPTTQETGPEVKTASRGSEE
jgi:hypothetical protein